MLRAIAQRLGLVSSRRSLDAAGGGRRWRDAPPAVSASTVAANAGTVAQRAQAFAINNATGARIVEILTANVIGAGIKPRSLHASENVRRGFHARFAAWTDEADADATGDLFALQAAAVRDMIVLGEALFLIEDDARTGAPRLRRLHPDQLDRTMTRRLGDNGQIVQGIEFDRDGKIVAYHLKSRADFVHFTPGTPAGAAWPPVRLPAGNVIHMFRPLVPGQVRGLSWFAPILLPARELDALTDALVVRAKVAALHAGFVIDPDGSPPYDGEQSGSTLDASLEPGALITLPPGKSIEFPDVPDQGGAQAAMTSMMRAIAAGVGITYEQASGDFSQVNYSSARAALLEFRRFIEGVQHHTVVFQFCRPIWRRFVRWQVLDGRIPAAAYAADRTAFEAVKWLPPAWQWVDPQKDAKAAEIELKNNLRSRSEIIAERGYDAEEVDAEIAADAARLARLGVRLETKT